MDRHRRPEPQGGRFIYKAREAPKCLSRENQNWGSHDGAREAAENQRIPR